MSETLLASGTCCGEVTMTGPSSASLSRASIVIGDGFLSCTLPATAPAGLKSEASPLKRLLWCLVAANGSPLGDVRPGACGTPPQDGTIGWATRWLKLSWLDSGLEPAVSKKDRGTGTRSYTHQRMVALVELVRTMSLGLGARAPAVALPLVASDGALVFIVMTVVVRVKGRLKEGGKYNECCCW